MTVPSKDHWSLDKKVPIALVITIIIQTLGIAWWAATLSSQVNYLESRVTKAEGIIEREAVSTRLASDRLIRVEEGVKALLEFARRVERGGQPERSAPYQ